MESQKEKVHELRRRLRGEKERARRVQRVAARVQRTRNVLLRPRMGNLFAIPTTTPRSGARTKAASSCMCAGHASKSTRFTNARVQHQRLKVLERLPLDARKDLNLQRQDQSL
jgi:hypothetical protein